MYASDLAINFDELEDCLSHEKSKIIKDDHLS